MAYSISIHAPARGATENASVCVVKIPFQSTLPHGERRWGQQSAPAPTQFQSTLPHGERLTLLSRGASVSNDFNPRSRTGSDRFGQ